MMQLPPSQLLAIVVRIQFDIKVTCVRVGPSSMEQ
jgi:hypothetical protein